MIMKLTIIPVHKPFDSDQLEFARVVHKTNGGLTIPYLNIIPPEQSMGSTASTSSQWIFEWHPMASTQHRKNLHLFTSHRSLPVTSIANTFNEACENFFISSANFSIESPVKSRLLEVLQKKLDEKLAIYINSLTNDVVWLNMLFNEFNRLFREIEDPAPSTKVTSDEQIRILENSAPYFFRLHYWTAQQAILSQIGRLTDPPETKGSDNLTFEGLTKELTKRIVDLTLITSINNILDSVKEEINQIRLYRNKILAHNDLDTILRFKLRPRSHTLAIPPFDKIKNIIRSFTEIINLVSTEFADTSNDFIRRELFGADRLIEVLQHGLEYEAIKRQEEQRNFENTLNLNT